MKGKSGKWCGIIRLVVNKVKCLKKPGMVHQPVRPVKISIVAKDHHRDRKKIIPPTIC
jgi:hypothetical protein